MADELPPDRPFLESLTTAELLKRADSLGIDLPPGLDRTIVIEELLETGDAGDLQFLGGKRTPGTYPNPGAVQSPVGAQTAIPDSPPPAEKSDGKSAQSASAPLPKHYNISFIEVLIRDPLWAFAFWEINAHDKETLEGAPDFCGYCLRVIPMPGAGDSSFTVPIGAGDSAWYLGFPPEGGRFKVELCAMRKDESLVLAVSKPFRLPKLPESGEAGASLTGDPLLRLSGIDDFSILRNTVRSSRLPKRYYAHTGLSAAGLRE